MGGNEESPGGRTGGVGVSFRLPEHRLRVFSVDVDDSNTLTEDRCDVCKCDTINDCLRLRRCSLCVVKLC